MALASVAPHALNEIVLNFEKGELARAKEIQLRLIPPNAAVTSQYGIAGLKAALDLIGMYGGPVRPPLLPLEPSQADDLKRTLHEANLL
jgi:4-hydroxy-2-oxoglutarate aldolase